MADLTLSEFQRSKLVRMFEVPDVDRDGHITLWELVEAMRDFLLGSDPEAAGNYLYGPVE